MMYSKQSYRLGAILIITSNNNHQSITDGVGEFSASRGEDAIIKTVERDQRCGR